MLFSYFTHQHNTNTELQLADTDKFSVLMIQRTNCATFLEFYRPKTQMGCAYGHNQKANI